MSDQNAMENTGFLNNIVGPRRARIALMGEFSAGKSTLANLMIGTDPLPMQVVATRLPPVWVSYGTAQPAVVDLSGNEQPCDINDLSDLDPEDVAFIRLQRQEQILERCDIIDMPGISDPNMTSNVWKRLLPAVDGVVWCSAATQAWRQSEAAAWAAISEPFERFSMLLLTRVDMLTSERDQKRVLKRVQADPTARFRQILPISLVNARAAVDDETQWVSSGADRFVTGFLSLVDAVTGQLEKQESGDQPTPERQQSPIIKPRRPVRRKISRQGSTLDPNAPESFTPKFS